jgi:GNAT superfamily N-acetyltransferase
MAADVQVRHAAAGDLDGLVELAARRRERYRQYQPQFWQPADDATQRQREFFVSLLENEEGVILVAHDDTSPLRGFAIARVVAAPPIYDPGGRTCVVDDFTVADSADWLDAGTALLDEVRRWGADRGAVQLVVVTAHLDEEKRSALRAAQLKLASEWWVGTAVRTDT